MYMYLSVAQITELIFWQIYCIHTNVNAEEYLFSNSNFPQYLRDFYVMRNDTKKILSIFVLRVSELNTLIDFTETTTCLTL